MSSPEAARQLAGMERVGPILRAKRKQQRLTLQDVATAADLTPSFISLVERGKTRASVPALLRICAALDIPLGALFDYPVTPVVEAGHGATLEMGGSGITEYILTPAEEERFVVMQTILEPGGGSGGPYSLAAETIFAFVVTGTLELIIDGTKQTLHQGDSTTFRATATHEWSNPSTRETEVLWTIAPALGRRGARDRT